MQLTLYDESLQEVERVLALDAAHADARLEKANLLYLANRLTEARDWLAAEFESGAVARTPAALNLMGNAAYGLGRWDEAAEAYRQAASLQPDVALFLQNAARALERAGRTAEAVEHYGKAARRLYAEEAFDELSLILPRLQALAPNDSRILALEARMEYREGKTEEALVTLRHLEEQGSTDSAVHYLLGLILAERGARAEALPRFTRAAELEPDYALYHFRVAETLHMLGRDPTESLAQARSLAPSDPWSNNLEGQIRMEAGDPKAAVVFLRAAREAAPAEEVIALNLSEALSLAGENTEALQVIASLEAGAGESARTANQRGNILARSGDTGGRRTDVREGHPDGTGKCHLQGKLRGRLHRAGHGSPRGGAARADRTGPSLGIRLQPAGTGGRAEGRAGARGDGLHRRPAARPAQPRHRREPRAPAPGAGKHDAARDLLVSVLASHPGHARARSLLDRIRAERETRLACATCGREWWVPRDIPPQPALRIRGEPPADAPAGRCPACAKVYCVGCAAAHLREMRFFCPGDGEFLKLSEDALKWLLRKAIERPSSSSGSVT